MKRLRVTITDEYVRYEIVANGFVDKLKCMDKLDPDNKDFDYVSEGDRLAEKHGI